MEHSLPLFLQLHLLVLHSSFTLAAFQQTGDSGINSRYICWTVPVNGERVTVGFPPTT